MWMASRCAADCARLRPELAILILTVRGQELDVVAGLDAGADDYLTKPFRLSELLARIRSQLRRVTPANEPADALQVAGLRIDRAARRAWLDDEELVLRPKEFDLLVLLATHPGIALTRSRIMDAVWETSWLGSTKTLDTHVLALRQKLGAACDHHPARGRLPLRSAVRRRLVLAIVGVTAGAIILFGIPLALVLQRAYRDEELVRLQRDTVGATRNIDLPQRTQDPPELPRFSGQIGIYSAVGNLLAGAGPPHGDTTVARAIALRAPEGTAAGDVLVVASPLFSGERVTGAVRGRRSQAAVPTRPTGPGWKSPRSVSRFWRSPRSARCSPSADAWPHRSKLSRRSPGASARATSPPGRRTASSPRSTSCARR